MTIPNRFIAFLIILICIVPEVYGQTNLSKLTSELPKVNARLLPSEIGELSPKDQIRSTKSGIQHSYFEQKINGIPIFGATASIHTDAGGNIIKINEKLVHQPNQKKNISAPQISSSAATTAIGNHLNKGVQPTKSPIQVYFKIGESLRLAWQIQVTEDDAHEWLFIVDAETGNILKKINKVITCHFSEGCGHSHDHTHNSKEKPASSIDFDGLLLQHNKTSNFAGGYNVFAMPLPSPYFGDRTLVTDPEELTASPYGWHDTDGIAGAEYTITRGNNVHAYEDGDNPGFSPDGGAALLFDFPLDTNFTVSNQYEAASLTNLFYWTNVVHDVIYQYGFDEASGNFQANNYGKGGIDGDYINAEGQNSNNTCNANIRVEADGIKPRIQMYACNNHDGSFDNRVIVHEIGHGISIRLTGGPSTALCLFNTEQMGEGWSDYYGLLFTQDATITASTPIAVGNFLKASGIDGPGFRPYPYTTDMTVNPHTYDDIKSATVPHGIGSIWCAMLWDMTWGLIDQYGFDSDIYFGTGGNNIALHLVTEGLKLQSCFPGFVDGRDAILAADMALYGGANQCIIWEAFTRRGLGVTAIQGDSDNRSDGIESFVLPESCGGPVCNSSISPTSFSFGGNAGTDSLIIVADGDWNAGSNVPWITVASSTGNGNGTLYYSYNANLIEGPRTGSIFVLCGSSTLEIIVAQDSSANCSGLYASVPYFRDFEDGGIDKFWCLSRSSAAGSIEIRNNGEAPQGNFHLTLAKSEQFFIHNNKADLSVDLSNTSYPQLEFWYRDYSVFSDLKESELLVSDDGGTSFTQLVDLRGVAGPYWEKLSLDLNALLNLHGLSKSATFVFRFNQTGYNPIPSDGLELDDFKIIDEQRCDLAVKESFLQVPNYDSSPTFEIKASGEWNAISSVNWITLSPSSSMGDGTISMDVESNNVTGALRSGKVTINCDNSTQIVSIAQRNTAFAITPHCDLNFATLPYSTGFESTEFDPYWCLFGAGIMEITTEESPYNGNYHLTSYSKSNGQNNEHDMSLGLNLSLKENVQLSFWWKEWNDTDEPYEGIFFSDNGGGNFTKVFEFPSAVSGWTNFILNVDSLVNVHGLSMTENFVVDFRHLARNNKSISGFAFDDIHVTGTDLQDNCLFDLDNNQLSFDRVASPQTVNLTANENWTATADASWITVTPSTGSGNASLTIKVSDNTNNFDRTGTVTVSCGYTSKTIAIHQWGLPCMQFATIPYTTSFEAGELDQYWCTSTLDQYGQVVVSNVDANTGNYTLHLTGNASYHEYRNEAYLGVNLAGVVNANLSFFLDTENIQSNPEDGVYFSDDGGQNYTLVFSFGASTFPWKEYTLNIDQLINVNGLQKTDQFVIKFVEYNTYMNNSNPKTGRLIDDISVYSGIASTCYLDHPGTLTFSEFGGTKDVEIITNTSWAKYSGNSWYTFSPTNGIGNTIITLDADTNKTSVRTTIFDSRCSDFQSTILLVQEGMRSDCSQRIYATFPYTTGFEDGFLDESWCTYTDHEYGDIRIQDQYNPYEGSFYLTLSNKNGTFFTNKEASLGIKLDGVIQPELSFWWKSFYERYHITDGVYFSDDGGENYTKVYDFKNVSHSNWMQVTLDIDSLTTIHGLSKTDAFVIKFQEFDNYRLSPTSVISAGIGLDEIQVTTAGLPCAPGNTCDDGDACTVNDIYDNFCNCNGVFADADNDSVCDDLDTCPGFDDLADIDNDSIPDGCDLCNSESQGFPSTSLTHVGAGSSTMSLVFSEPPFDPVFTISGLSQVVGGNPASRYIDVVTVSYVDENGNTIQQGTYSAADFSSTPVSILGTVQEIILALSDGYDGTADANMSVNVSAVDYCMATPPTCIDVDVHVWMEGAYDPNLNEMSTVLNTQFGILPGQTPKTNGTPTPPGQPYNVSPWNYPGTEGDTWLDLDYTADMVDWILVSFRTAPESSTEIGRAAAVVNKDGSLYFPQCPLNNIGNTDVYIVLEHRNHMGVMSATPITEQNNTLVYDFRQTDSYLDGAGSGQKQLANGQWCMFVGDMDQFDSPGYDINGTDKLIWQNENGQFLIYLNADLNLDGDINGADKILWTINNGYFSSVQK